MSTATTHIKTDKQLVPKLRFNEFEEIWSSKQLKEITSYVDYRGRGPEKSEQGIYLVTAKNIKKGFIDYECSKEYVPTENRSIVMSKGLPEVGDILFTTEAPLGNVAQVDNSDIALAQRVIKFRGKDELLNDYLLHFMISPIYQKLITRKAIGTTVLGISGKELHKTNIQFPSLPEQQKIASFLSAVDEKIQQLTKKKALLEQYKKGVMQQLFSYEKRLYKGELRKGNLGNFGYFYYGKGAPKTSIVEGAPTPCVRYGELYSTFKEEIKEIKSYTIVDPKDLKLSKGGEVLVPRVGEKPLEFANCSYLPFADVAIGEMISVYNTEEDGLFMTYYINARLQKQLARMVEGGNVSNLYFRYVEKIEVEIPCVEEQQKIIGFLSSIDTKIESVNNQITQIQTFKKGLLQQMFV